MLNTSKYTSRGANLTISADSATRQGFSKALRAVLRYAPGTREQRPAFVYDLPTLRNPNLRQLENLAAPSVWAHREYGTMLGLLTAIHERRTTAEDALSLVLNNVRAYNEAYNAFVFVSEEAALDEAKALDRHRTSTPQKSLEGVPVSIKDVIHVAGMPTTAGSAVPSGFLPTEDSAAVARIRQAGGIILGKTQTHEFALGVTQPQSTNPWDSTRVPGGSSGGAAIALITGMCLAALGTDTRASIRVPAALCGTVGYKPTYGLLPVDGIVPLSWSMDHCAAMARTVEDVALLAEVAARRPGYETVELSSSTRKGVRGLKVGVPEATLIGADPEIEDAFTSAVASLSRAGVEIHPVIIPAADLDTANAMGLILSRCEAAAYHRDWLTAYPRAYTRDVYEQLDEATKVRAVDYLQAQRYRAEFGARMDRLLREVDALAMPTTLIPAPRKEEAEHFLVSLSRNCVPWSLVGFPAISVPAGLTQAGLPVGLQFVSAPGNDATVLALGAALERSEHLNAFYQRVPSSWRLSFCAPRPHVHGQRWRSS
jgi:aspartyl-tRNA(Asn)/glutamyl-tRNA(Gln) amidotransferase subunit A